MINQDESRGTSAPVSETTRYLCAAAYLDKTFANEVIDHVLHEEHRAIAPSYGVDLVPVICHCLAARRRRLVRDAVLVGLLVTVFPFFIVYGTPVLYSALAMLPLGWSVVFFTSYLDRQLLETRLLPEYFDPEAAPIPSSPRDVRLITELQPDMKSNVTVYSGFSPFVGSGLENEGWSFTTNTQKGKETLDGLAEPVPFEVDELYNFISTDLRGLDIDGLRVENRLFVNGQDIRSESWILPNQFSRPLTTVDDALVQHFLRAPTQRIRHYLVIQIESWRGELVMSIFLRFTQVGATLFSEAAYCLLPPLREKYHEIDDIPPDSDARVIIQLMAKAVVTTPALLILAPIHVAQRIFSGPRRRLESRSIRRRIRTTPMFDYGSVTSVRQSGMSTNYRRYFQKLDREMYVKLVQQRILDLITEFLDKRNIDTSDLKERTTSIMNNGVIVSGGSIQTESMAVGVGARARVDRALKTLAQKAPTQTGKS
ncbi:MAG TPA: hypothetical protein VJ757_08650 [Pseudonocardiaceae bacterium]|nr:hypothetical protein [Pseudonocardiaceae bacterium]